MRIHEAFWGQKNDSHPLECIVLYIPWRIHGAAIYGVPWIPSIYPLYVSIYTSTMDPICIVHYIPLPLIPCISLYIYIYEGLLKNEHPKAAEISARQETRGRWGVVFQGRSGFYPFLESLDGFVWKCWVNIPNEIAIFHRDNDQQNHWENGVLTIFRHTQRLKSDIELLRHMCRYTSFRT